MKSCYHAVMKQEIPVHEIKTVGSSGQIYLGKEFAGQHVIVVQERVGVWTIKAADVIPHDEKWLHTPENSAKLEAALTEARSQGVKVTPPAEMEAIFEKALKQASKPKRK
jgi:putative transposon-encoded protein